MRSLGGWVAGVVLFSCLAVHAHQLKQSVSELNWRVNDARLEVIHALHLDDAMALWAR